MFKSKETEKSSSPSSGETYPNNIKGKFFS